MDLGRPISYLALANGTAVYTSDGEHIGHVTHVLASDRESLFEGIVIEERLGPGGHRFVEPDLIADIFTEGVLLKLDRAQAADLPQPSPDPPVMYDDSAGTPSSSLADKLKRAWDRMSGGS